jgi:dipeptidase
VIATAILAGIAQACTNVLVSKTASKEGANTIAYNADASNFYTTIYHYPR